MTSFSPRDLNHAKLEELRNQFMAQPNGAGTDASVTNGAVPQDDPAPVRPDFLADEESLVDFGEDETPADISVYDVFDEDEDDLVEDSPVYQDEVEEQYEVEDQYEYDVAETVTPDPEPEPVPVARPTRASRPVSAPRTVPTAPAVREPAPATDVSDEDLLDLLRRMASTDPGRLSRLKDETLPVTEDTIRTVPSPMSSPRIPRPQAAQPAPAPRRAAAPAPEPTPAARRRVVKEAGGDPVQHELPSFTLDQRRKEGPQQGWRSVVARMGMNIDKSQAEKEYDHDIDLINKQLRYARVVGVAGFKGGTGKTAATVCLGSTIGEHRSTGEVVGIDADENGTLARRMKGTQPSNVKAFAADDRLQTTNDVRAHLMVNDHRFSVLGSSTSPTAYPLIPEEYEVAVDRLKDDYSIVMVDMDTSAASPAYETIMDSLHALVLIIAPTLESVSLGQNMVAWLRERDLGDVLSRTLVLINHQSPAKSHVNLEQVVAHFRDREHLKVLEIPWDEHLAEAGEVNLDLLNKPTRRQFVRAAATIIDSLPSS